jgi:hypothetical protein
MKRELLTEMARIVQPRRELPRLVLLVADEKSAAMSLSRAYHAPTATSTRDHVLLADGLQSSTLGILYFICVLCMYDCWVPNIKIDLQPQNKQISRIHITILALFNAAWAARASRTEAGIAKFASGQCKQLPGGHPGTSISCGRRPQ